MSVRLNILFAQDRAPYPCFTTSELSELLDLSEKKIRVRAKSEGWQRFTMNEVGEDDAIDSYPVWDVSTMPEETRRQIATGHYTAEEKDNPLLVEVEAEAQHIRFYFSHAAFPVIRAAIYRARQFSMIQDAIISLQLSAEAAIEAIAAAYGIDAGIFFELESYFIPFNGRPFFLLQEDIRLLLLVHYFSAYSGELLPEYLPEDVQERQWN